MEINRPASADKCNHNHLSVSFAEISLSNADQTSLKKWSALYEVWLWGENLWFVLNSISFARLLVNSALAGKASDSTWYFARHQWNRERERERLRGERDRERERDERERERETERYWERKKQWKRQPDKNNKRKGDACPCIKGRKRQEIT